MDTSSPGCSGGFQNLVCRLSPKTSVPKRNMEGCCASATSCRGWSGFIPVIERCVPPITIFQLNSAGSKVRGFFFLPNEKIKPATRSVKLRGVSFDSTAISMGSKLASIKHSTNVTMGEYRAYVIGADGHIQLRVDLVVPDETTARKRAKQLVNGHAVELWD
jgi:hypothetical protein